MLTRTNGTVYSFTIQEHLGPVITQIKDIREQIMKILQQAKEELKNPLLSSPPSSQPEFEELPDEDPLEEALQSSDDDQ